MKIQVFLLPYLLRLRPLTMAIFHAGHVAQLQANLLLAEQSVEYGKINLEDIGNELKFVDDKLEAVRVKLGEAESPMYLEAEESHERDTVRLIEERMLIVMEIDTSKSRIASLKAQLKKFGSGPKENLSMEEMTLGARMAMLTLSKEPSNMQSFALQSAYRHRDNARRFEEKAKEALKAKHMGAYTHAKSAAHFNYAASGMLMSAVRLDRGLCGLLYALLLTPLTEPPLPSFPTAL